MIGGDEESVAALDALLVDLANCLIRLGDTLDGGLVDTSVANHVGGSKVVHDELELALLDALANLFGNTHGAHRGLKVVGSNTRRGDHVTVLVLELLLDTAVEEEGNVSVLLSLGNVALSDTLLAKPLGQDIAHLLRREGNGESVLRVVLGHVGEGDVLRVGEVRLGRAVEVAE